MIAGSVIAALTAGLFVMFSLFVSPIEPRFIYTVKIDCINVYTVRSMTDPWMTSEAAVQRLGVKPETLYAYVSRGVIQSERIPGSRRSRFLRADVERLAARQRGGGGRAGGLEVIIETDLTLLDPAGSLAYRGWDVVDAVADATFEEVASWLWHGTRERVSFEAPPAMIDIAGRVRRAIADQPVMDQLRAAIAAVRHTDPFRDDRRPEAVAGAGRAIITTLIETLPLVGAPAPAKASIAARLWPRISSQPPKPRLVKVLDATLVLLADHEMAASTLAARVAASTWADPYLVELAGLATLGGPLHGAASSASRQMMREAIGSSPAEAIGARLRENQLIPGFGHRVYKTHDPRAAILLEMLAAVRREPVEEELMLIMRERGLPFPNIDFAIAAFAERYDMIDNAGEVIFAIARTAGWLAHAIEEYRYRLRFRPRAIYTGVALAD